MSIKTYFGHLVKDITVDALKRYPNESCGLVVDDVYISCENIAEIPLTDFRISNETYLYYSNKGSVQAVVHSHNDFPHASKKDMESQMTTAVPWGIVNIRNSNISSVFWFGDQLEIQDLLGRPFYHGVYDCYSLARDYYREKGIVLRDVSREWKWWEKEDSLYLDGLKESGFISIDRKDLKEGDALLFQIGKTNSVNHCGIYLDKGLLLHHLVNRLSKREAVSPWANKYATHFLRYSG